MKSMSSWSPMRKYALFLLVVSLLVSTGGCQALLTAMIMIKGTDTEPKFDILLHDKKKVVVVCQSLARDQYRNEAVPRDIARQVTDLLDANVKNNKLELVPCSNVEVWIDNCDNRFDSFREVGKAKGIEADIVIGIEIQDFRVTDPRSPTLLQGKANILVKAINCEDGKILAREQMRIVDPPNMPLSSSYVNEHVFRASFVTVVSQQIACLFHPYDAKRLNRMDADSLGMH